MELSAFQINTFDWRSVLQMIFLLFFFDLCTLLKILLIYTKLFLQSIGFFFFWRTNMNCINVNLCEVSWNTRTEDFLRSREMWRGSGENIRKPISGGAEKNDKHIQTGTEKSLPAKDTRSRNRRGHRQWALLVVSWCAQFSPS